MGTFGRLVFCEVRTQIVGKTQFFDSLEHFTGSITCFAAAGKDRHVK